MKIRNTLIQLLTIIFFCIFSLTSTTPLLAQSLTDIQAQIALKNQQLADLQKSINSAQADLNSKQSVVNSTNQQVTNLSSQINQINSTLNLNKLKLEDLTTKLNLEQLQIQEQNKLQDLQVNSAYLNWKTGGGDSLGIFNGSDLVKSSIYNEALSTKNYGGITNIAQDLNNLQSQYSNYQSQSSQLQGQIDTLLLQRQSAQTQLTSATSNVSQSQNNVSGLRTSGTVLQSEIGQLSAQEKSVLDYENSLLAQANSNPGATNTLTSGKYYFSGIGRDENQGHGIGMSQLGALGAAVNGWDYKKILAFYYQGTTVGGGGDVPASVNVDGIGGVPMEDYVSGGGEVPDNSCEDLGIKFNPNNIWVCWPREAIKAQVVAYRTYGARHADHVYQGAASQVYKGGQAKKWAAVATQGQVVRYGGGIANVFYSSDNDQGKGTADNDTVWSNYSGNASHIPYLTSVNDDSFSYKTQWTHWTWRTNSYGISDFNSMLSWIAANSQFSGNSFIAQVKSDIGNLKQLNFTRDNSDRVKKVTLIGDKGSRVIAGWLFKSAWNVWVGTVKPSGQQDYIYSLTYFLLQK